MVRHGMRSRRATWFKFMTLAVLGLSIVTPANAQMQLDRSTVRVDGAELRLVLTPADRDGIVKGAVAIDLDPGWKTYWIKPGPVGLAPTFDFSGSRGLGPVAIQFPPPVRFREGDTRSIGYDVATLFPLTARQIDSGQPTATVAITLGLCRDLCVPVSVTLRAEPSASLATRATVIAAESRLATPGDPHQIALAFDGVTLTAVIREPDVRQSPDLFLNGGPNWEFGGFPPVVERNGMGWIARLTAKRRAATADAGKTIDIMLTSGEIARSYRAVPVAPVSPNGE